MTYKELQLAGKLLGLASDEFANHGCNDIEEDVWKGWSEEERKELIAEYYEWANEPEEAAEGHADIEDFALMSFLAHKLKAEK